MRWLINALSEPGELVCSLFCGVAPCGIAAVQLGRRYRGIEQSAEYRKIAEGRIAAYKDQPKDDDQDEDESPDRRTYYNFRLGKLRPRACDQETPPGLARFLFETISPVYKVQTILDPCAGRGAMTSPGEVGGSSVSRSKRERTSSSVRIGSSAIWCFATLHLAKKPNPSRATSLSSS
jgi:hypothetical protein